MNKDNLNDLNELIRAIDPDNKIFKESKNIIESELDKEKKEISPVKIMKVPSLKNDDIQNQTTFQQ